MKKILLLLVSLMLLTSLASATVYTVGPKEHIKSIQKAVYLADDGDVIKVQPGTYKEYVEITRDVAIYGTKYPTVYGFKSDSAGPATINGFKITKHGIVLSNVGDNYIRNNYFSNCGVSLTSAKCSANRIMNNQFSNGGISLSASLYNSITGNTISKAATGLKLTNGASCDTITKNKFQYCTVGVQVPAIPKCLIGNTYYKNKVNIKIVK